MKKHSAQLKPADFVVIGGLVLVAAITYWLLLPQLNRLEQHRQVAVAKQAELNRLQTHYEGLVLLTEQLPRFRKQLDLLSVAYPNEPQKAEAMTQVQAMAERSGLTVASLSPGQARPDTLSIVTNVKGSYEAYQTFTKELANNLRPAIVKSYTLSTESNNSRALLNGSFTIDLPYDPAITVTTTVPGGAQ